MAKDYGRRKPMRQKSSAPKQLFWVLASFLCGYLTATVFDFTSLSSWVNTNILANRNGEKPQAQAVAKQAELPKPKFEFYTLLAKDRSAQPPLNRPTAPVQAKPAGQPALPTAAPTPLASNRQQQPATVAVTESKPVATANLSKGSYLIQIASFKNRQDAERMKAALTLKGFDVNVAMTSQQQVNWFRVIVGPFNSRMAAEKVQLALAQSERIQGMIRKMEA